MTELKPCPFCGGKAELIRERVFYAWCDKLIYVWCDKCETRGDYYNTESEAVAAWNSRAERTCEVEVRDTAYGGYTRHCGNCGADLDCDTRNKQNYCPNCGCKVVGE